MINLPLPDELVEQIETIAQREQRLVAEVVADMLRQYDVDSQTEANDELHPLDAFIGIFDDDITDMSTSVRKTIRQRFRDKDARSD